MQVTKLMNWRKIPSQSNFTPKASQSTLQNWNHPTNGGAFTSKALFRPFPVRQTAPQLFHRLSPARPESAHKKVIKRSTYIEVRTNFVHNRLERDFLELTDGLDDNFAVFPLNVTDVGSRGGIHDWSKRPANGFNFRFTKRCRRKNSSQTKSKHRKQTKKPPAIKIWFYLGETCSPLFDFRVIRFKEDVL